MVGSRSIARRELLVLPRLVQLVADGDKAPVDGECGCVQVDVVPLQSEQLTAAESGVGEQPQGGKQPVAGRLTKKRPQFLRGPGLLFHLGYRPHLGGVGHQSDVSSHDPTPYSVVESATDDEMDLPHRLGSQRPLLVPRMQFLLVELLEVMGSKAADRDTPESRENMPSILRRYPSHVLCAKVTFFPGSQRAVR